MTSAVEVEREPSVAGSAVGRLRQRPLIGREREMDEVSAGVLSCPVTTVTGPGGVGKTVLAMAVASAVADDFPGGVWPVWLASLRTPELVAAEVAASLGLPRSRGLSYGDALAEWLDDQDVLVLLDNCEHVSPAVADLVDELTTRLPRLRVLATSREPLWVDGEATVRLSPLEVAGPAASAAETAASPAVRLFKERAAARTPRAATSGDERLMAEICQRLDGLPLAIELAAARVAGLELADINDHLDDLFTLLPQAPRRADGARRNLYATIEWSDSLLADDERALLHRLSVFAGAFDLAAVHGVCAPDGQPPARTADLVARLVDKSLLMKIDGRYQLLETIRQYGIGMLESADQLDALRDAHARWFVALALSAGEGLMTGPERPHVEHLQRIEDNLRLTLERLIEIDPPAAMELATTLTMFWWMQGKHREGMRWLEGARAALPPETPPELRAAARFHYAYLLAHDTDDWAAAALLLDEGIAEVETDDAPPLILGYLLCLRGESHVFAGETDAALDRTTRGLDIIGQHPDTWGRGFGLWNVGYAREAAADAEGAVDAWEEQIELAHRHGLDLVEMVGCNSLGSLMERREDLERARSLYERALDLRRGLGAARLGYVHGSLPQSLVSIARVSAQQGQHDVASALLAEARPLAEEMRDAATVDEITALLARTEPGVSVDHAVMRCEHGVWHVSFEGREAHVADAKGLWHLRELVVRPHHPVPAMVLANARHASPLDTGDAGPQLDREALRQYRQRLADLDDDLAEAERYHDEGRAARLATERDALIAELARATGLGGRTRRAGSSVERARLNVTRTIRHAIKLLDEVLPELAAHLDQSVTTGRHCCYQPSHEIAWTT
jgi:non-specific serine/threonine protein kinase